MTQCDSQVQAELESCGDARITSSRLSMNWVWGEMLLPVSSPESGYRQREMLSLDHPSSVVCRRIHRFPSVPPTETSEELLACFPGQCACMGSHEEDSGCFICCFLQKQRKMFACSPKWSKEVLGETVSPLLCIDVRNVLANLVFGLHLRFTLPLVGSPTSKPASVMHTPLLCCCQPDHCHAMHGTADSRC